MKGFSARRSKDQLQQSLRNSRGVPSGPAVKNPPHGARVIASIPGLGRSLIKDRETWHAAVHGGHKESDMTERLNNNHILRQSQFL